MIMSKETLIKSIREVPDFPIPGILFYDVTTLFKDPWCLQELSNIMFDMYKDKGITKVVGIESRGFIMGPILATRLNAGFIPIRKPGKLPAETIEESYDKEYGKEMCIRDSIYTPTQVLRTSLYKEAVFMVECIS